MIPEGVSQGLPPNLPKQFSVQKPWINKLTSLPPCSKSNAWPLSPDDSKPYTDLNGKKNPKVLHICNDFCFNKTDFVCFPWSLKCQKSSLFPRGSLHKCPCFYEKWLGLFFQLKRAWFPPFSHSIILTFFMILFLWGNPDFSPPISHCYLFDHLLAACHTPALHRGHLT